VTVEPWILDFDGDLYGQPLRLEFYKFVRSERKFDGLDALKAEICRNAEETRRFFKAQQ
jgi:riboflavin kinase/FMN adenylyltransferase